jgi:hypothetical protein
MSNAKHRSRSTCYPESTNKNRRYVEDVVPMYYPDVFKRHFRLSRGTDEFLCQELGPHMVYGERFRGGHQRIPHETQILMTLRMLGNQYTYLDIGYKDFACQKGMRGVIGAIDGTHIPIKRPSVDQEDYFNRKKYHSLIVQAVATPSLMFTDLFIGWPGSTHDSRVFRNSPLSELIVY